MKMVGAAGGVALLAGALGTLVRPTGTNLTLFRELLTFYAKFHDFV